ncbi:hypothetical protein LK09_19360 [Microbacterium mangrovi]|uniref:Carbohydrate kinase PfkB domain-containing protein n=1 Tax=Microbacterium mangrovi TaxID=1348253 RepID=A0A0B1ZW09_9MICO|nr:carbohydrate kinase [Microbacterium mangrovi]KHK95393.1 hypothetical protein LK09_19360 [Microbacterium mangrovi]
MTRVAVVGEALVDVIGTTAHPGGSPVNVAVGLARLGLDVTMMTRFGRDAHGRLLEEHLARAGVTLAPGSAAPGARTSSAHVTLDEHGAAMYAFDVSWDVAPPDLGGFDLVHTGSIGAYLEPGASAVASALAGVPGGTVVSFDPNIRPALVGARAEAVARTERIAALSHIVKLSDEDASWLYPGMPVLDVLRRLSGLGARLAVATLGARGCLAIAGADVFEVPAPPVVVADTVGAGDSFMSGLLAALVADAGPGVVAAGTEPGRGWEHALRFALWSAAVTVARPGADPPWADELVSPGGDRPTHAA